MKSFLDLFRKVPPPQKRTNVMKQILKKRWPLYPGGFTAKGVTKKLYGPVPGTNVPLTILYNRNKKRNISILKNVKNLQVGETYLFLIEATRDGTFNTKFLKTENGRIEFNRRHAFFENINNPHEKVVVAAGEIRKSLVGYRFNLESGTFMTGLREWYRNAGGNYTNYPKFVKEVMNIPNANYTTNVLMNTRNTMTANEVFNRASQCPGLTLKGYVSKLRGAPSLSYKNCVNAYKNRKTRSKGPVNPKMQLN